MNTHTTTSPGTPLSVLPTQPKPGWVELALLAAALLFMFVPTYAKLAEQIWSQDGQGHGPIMLALAAWLFWKRLPELIFAEKLSIVERAVAIFLFTFGCLLYILGKSQDFPEFEASAQIFIFSSLIVFYCGLHGLKKMWFPIFFLLFVVPLPSIVVVTITAPLKMGVSYVAEAVLYQIGYPIGRTGVTLTIGQYQLLVADACAGLNSVFALEAIGVFYMSIMGYTNKWRNICLAVLILPISFIANVIRVITLVLVTYYFGDEAGQGFVHDFAGILLFMVATLLTIGTDSILGLFMKPHADGHNAGAQQDQNTKNGIAITENRV